jgi:hypothetical protein
VVGANRKRGGKAKMSRSGLKEEERISAIGASDQSRIAATATPLSSRVAMRLERAAFERNRDSETG